MKKIEAIIRSEKVGDVRRALETVGFSGLTLTQVQGHGKQKGTTQKLGGHEYKVGILPKTKIEIVAEEDEVDPIIDAIISAGKTGNIGDGKIFIYDIQNVIRIRTGEKGKEAL